MKKDFEVKFCVEVVGVEAELYDTFSEARTEAFRVAKEKKEFVFIYKQGFYREKVIDDAVAEVLRISGAELY